jgi:site-specific recombinase XerD
MHDLVPALIDPGSVPAIGTLTTDEMAATMAYAEAQHSAATLAAYASDWNQFAAWCASREATALPAHPGMVGAYLSHLAASGFRSSSIGRKCAAIAHRHKAHGCDPLPTSSEGVRAVLKGIRRTIGSAKQGKAPATAEIVRRMLAATPDTLKGKRDRALLSLGLAGAFRRSELVALQVSDLQEVEDGLLVTIRRSKTDQEGQGVLIGILRGTRIRPVKLVREWLDAAGITEGPVFRAVALGGRMSSEPLSGDAVASLVKHYAERIGLDPRAYAAHSLRAGMITSSAEAGANVFRIMDLSRHKSVDMIRTYVRAVDVWKDHAGAGVL